MLGSDRFAFDSPNVIDPGDLPPSRPQRQSSVSQQEEQQQSQSQRRRGSNTDSTDENSSSSDEFREPANSAARLLRDIEDIDHLAADYDPYDEEEAAASAAGSSYNTHQHQHEQLPSVEEARMYATSLLSSEKSSKRRGSPANQRDHQETVPLSFNRTIKLDSRSSNHLVRKRVLRCLVPFLVVMGLLGTTIALGLVLVNRLADRDGSSGGNLVPVSRYEIIVDFLAREVSSKFDLETAGTPQEVRSTEIKLMLPVGTALCVSLAAEFSVPVYRDSVGVSYSNLLTYIAFAHFHILTKTTQLAVNWVSDIDPLQYDIPTGQKEDDFQFVQRYVLSTLFFALRGTGWNDTLNFMTEQNECGWFQPMELDLVQLETAVGVTCDADLHVTGLFLPSNMLKGSIPAELRYLSHLTMLAMPYNELTGALPVGLSALSKLVYLDVRSNNLQGRIPTFVGDFEYLEVLGLSNNQFIGSVPPSMGTLRRLKTLALNENILTGSISFAGHLTNLEYLYADGNVLADQIGPDFLENLDRLRELDLSSNLLTCEEFPEKLLALPDLQVLNLAYNELGGSLPDYIPANNVLGFLSLQGNNLNGTIPINLPALARLSHLDLHRNNLVGSLPGRMRTMDSLTFLFLGDNDFYPGGLPDVLLELTNLKELSMSNTQRDSYIPYWIGLLSDLKLLDLSHNKLTGSIPDEVWNLPDMSYLLLHDNILNGTLPPTVAAADKLKVLSLHRNDFSGSARDLCDAAIHMDLFATDCITGIVCAPSCCPVCCRDDDDECFKEDFEVLHNLTSVDGDWGFNYKNTLYSFDPAILEESDVAVAIAFVP